MAADAVDLRRTEKRIASLREVPDPAPEVVAAIESLGQARAASQAAAQKMDEVRSARASALAALRRLYANVRRAVAVPTDADARADLEEVVARAGVRGLAGADHAAGDDQAETTTR